MNQIGKTLFFLSQGVKMISVSTSVIKLLSSSRMHEWSVHEQELQLINWEEIETQARNQKKNKKTAEVLRSFCWSLENKGVGEESGGDLDQGSDTEEDNSLEVVS